MSNLSNEESPLEYFVRRAQELDIPEEETRPIIEFLDESMRINKSPEACSYLKSVFIEGQLRHYMERKRKEGQPRYLRGKQKIENTFHPMDIWNNDCNNYWGVHVSLQNFCQADYNMDRLASLLFVIYWGDEYQIKFNRPKNPDFHDGEYKPFDPDTGWKLEISPEMSHTYLTDYPRFLEITSSIIGLPLKPERDEHGQSIDTCIDLNLNREQLENFLKTMTSEFKVNKPSASIHYII